MQKLQVLLVGCGAISKKHVDACIFSKDELALSGVCDIDSDRTESITKLYTESGGEQKPDQFNDIDKALSVVKPDICSIATSSSSHASLAIKALEAGCHVILEKPMTLSSSDAEAINETAEKKKKKLSVCYITRYAPHVMKARRYLEEGRFGSVFHVTANIFWNRNDDYYLQAPWRGTWEKDGGTLMNQCTHAIDLQQWFLNDKIERIHGVTRKYMRPIESEDFGTAVLECRNGAVGTLVGTVDVFPKNLGTRLSIFGEKGTVVFGGTHMDKVEIWLFEDENEYTPDNDAVTGHPALYADFIRTIHEDKNPLIDGYEGKKSLEIVLGIYRSMHEGHPISSPFDFDQEKMIGFDLTGIQK